jgi:tripeptide aminopeptidase
VSFEMKQIGERPAAELSKGARILEVVRAVDSHLRISSTLRRASTDANVPLSLGLEAVSIGAGGQGGGAHTLHEWYDPTGRDLGLKRILLTVLALSGIQ